MNQNPTRVPNKIDVAKIDVAKIDVAKIDVAKIDVAWKRVSTPSSVTAFDFM